MWWMAVFHAAVAFCCRATASGLVTGRLLLRRLGAGDLDVGDLDAVVVLRHGNLPFRREPL